MEAKKRSLSDKTIIIKIIIIFFNITILINPTIMMIIAKCVIHLCQGRIALGVTRPQHSSLMIMLKMVMMEIMAVVVPVIVMVVMIALIVMVIST